VSGADEHLVGEGPRVEPFLGGSAEAVGPRAMQRLLRPGVTRAPPPPTVQAPPGGRRRGLH